MKGGIKMSDIIKAIYRGEYNPMENLGDELELLTLDVLNKSEELNKTLNDEQKEKLEEFCEASSKVNSAMEAEAFKSYNLCYYVAKGWCNDDIILRAETQRHENH